MSKRACAAPQEALRSHARFEAARHRSGRKAVQPSQWMMVGSTGPLRWWRRSLTGTWSPPSAPSSRSASWRWRVFVLP